MISIGTKLTTISNRNDLEFKIAVDELDIPKLDYNKEVLVTIDALSGTKTSPIKGKIKKLPLEGLSQGGVTDYYVTIGLEGRDDIRISMTANADIIVSSLKDIIYIPLEALKEEDGESYVEVMEDGKEEPVKRSVTIGSSNSSYVQILEGIEEGEKVVVPELNAGGSLFMM
jgi:HlyD family secretion protein